MKESLQNLIGKLAHHYLEYGRNPGYLKAIEEVGKVLHTEFK